MRKIILILLPTLFLFSDEVNIDDVRDWNEAGQFNRICKDSVRDLFVKEQNYAVANIYAKACLKIDRVNDLIIPIVMLYKDKPSRENAAIYSTILFQKKMLYFAIVDGYDISYIRTPKVDYILSLIFDKFVDKEYKFENNRYIFDFSDDMRCDVFVKKENDIDKMVFEIYKFDKLISTKTYW